MAAIADLFFKSDVCIAAIASRFWGDVGKTERVLEDLIPREVVFVRTGHRVACCDGLVMLYDREIPSTISPDAREAYFRESGSAGSEVCIEVSHQGKLVLWQKILAVNGREFAEGFMWKRFIRDPGNALWQRMLATQIMHFVRYEGLVCTGHYLIDRSLAIIATVIDLLPLAHKQQVWSLLRAEEWSMTSLPSFWVAVEEKMGSKYVTCKDGGVSRVVGIIRLAARGKAIHPTYRCYAPGERNRIALVFLFLSAWEINKEADGLLQQLRITRVRAIRSKGVEDEEAEEEEGERIEREDEEEALVDKTCEEKWASLPVILRTLCEALALTPTKEELANRETQRILRASRLADARRSNKNRTQQVV